MCALHHAHTYAHTETDRGQRDVTVQYFPSSLIWYRPLDLSLSTFFFVFDLSFFPLPSFLNTSHFQPQATLTHYFC